MRTPARVLIVDDNEMARRLIRRLLEREGLDVYAEARDGQEAIEVVRSIHPDLVILDFLMPVKDGLQAAREILETEPSVRIVLNTLYITEQLRTVAEKIGVRHVTAKSDYKALRGALDSILKAAPLPFPN